MQTAVQAVWRFKVAAYLFLAGVGAGSIIIGIGSGWLTYAFESAVAIGLGLPIVAFSTVFLFLDLGRPARFYLAMHHCSTSWVSRGVLVLSVLIASGGMLWAVTIWPCAGVLNGRPALLFGIQAVTLAMAVAACTYTGILIAVLTSRPFWNNPLLPALFLLSALSAGTGVMLLVLSTAKFGESGPYLKYLGWIDIALIFAEAATLYLYLAFAFRRAPAVVNVFLKGRLAKLFWGGLVSVGIIAPLLLEFVALTIPPGEGSSMVMFIVGGLLLCGGFGLRYLILLGGVRGPLVAGAFFQVRPGY